MAWRSSRGNDSRISPPATPLERSDDGEPERPLTRPVDHPSAERPHVSETEL
ncbi:MAG: hypothetical protein J07HB67_00491, partial [halophilic archaeon J07HB67]